MSIKQVCDHCGKKHGPQTDYVKVVFKPFTIPVFGEWRGEDADFCNLACLTGWAQAQRAKYNYDIPEKTK